MSRQFKNTVNGRYLKEEKVELNYGILYLGILSFLCQNHDNLWVWERKQGQGENVF